MSIRKQQSQVILNFAPNIAKSIEYLNVRGFSIAASDVREQSDNESIFVVHKVYSWDAFGPNCCRCLFDAEMIPTVGVWKNNILLLYQKNDVGYLRWVYYLEYDIDFPRYRLSIYYSLNGEHWKKCLDN